MSDDSYELILWAVNSILGRPVKYVVEDIEEIISPFCPLTDGDYVKKISVYAQEVEPHYPPAVPHQLFSMKWNVVRTLSSVCSATKKGI